VRIDVPWNQAAPQPVCRGLEAVQGPGVRPLEQGEGGRTDQEADAHRGHGELGMEGQARPAALLPHVGPDADAEAADDEEQR